jgi:hypothetical protein
MNPDNRELTLRKEETELLGGNLPKKPEKE